MVPPTPLPGRRWLATPAPLPSLIPHRVLLVLPAAPETRQYRVHSGWAETVAGTGRRTRLERTVDLRLAPRGGTWHLTLRTAPPQLKKPDPTAFDDMALRLAGLYAELEGELAPTGEWGRLLNGAAIRQRWPGIEQELRQRYAADSDVVAALVAGVARQLATPAGLGPSLPANYLYAALPGDFYQQPFDSGHQYARPKGFPQFFDGLALHFTETLRLAPPDAAPPGQALLRLAGTLDPAATDLAAVAARVHAALGPDAPAVLPADLRFAYAATHVFDRNTGLPVAVELAVSCACPDRYHKEYSLTIAPILPA